MWIIEINRALRALTFVNVNHELKQYFECV